MKKKLGSVFEINNKFIPLIPKLDIIKIIDHKISIIDENYNYLLKKTKEQILVDKKMEELFKKHKIELEQKEYLKKIIMEKKRKRLMKRHQFIISSYNNKMLLDMILADENFIKYLSKLKKRNNEIKTEKTFTYYMTNTKGKSKIKRINTINIINKKSNNHEINIDNYKTSVIKEDTIQKEEVYNKRHNNYLKTDYVSTQNSEKNETIINNQISNYSNTKNELRKNSTKNSFSFPISSSFFTTSIPATLNNSITPKKSVLSLRKNKNDSNKQLLSNIFVELDNNKIINNNNFNIQKYKANSIKNYLNINNENKNQNSIIKIRNKNLFDVIKENNCSCKKHKFKTSLLSDSYINTIKPNYNKKRPLTSTNYRSKKTIL